MDLPVRIEEQERRFVRAWQVLREGVTRRAFPGASVAVTLDGELVALKGIGRFTYDEDSPEVTPETIYDLASLTKVLATTAMAMRLFERGMLRLHEPVHTVVPEFLAGNDSRRETVTLAQLLAHSSGLPGYVRLFEKHRGRDALMTAACQVPLEASPGARAEYSDIGFIILGEALERLAGEPLNGFCQREIFDPLGMEFAMFNPDLRWHGRIPPTEDDRTWRNRVVGGEVHDENAAAMGGIAGHAGLFGTAYDVAQFAECMLRGGAPLFRRETVELFTSRVASPAGSPRTLGWDTPTPPSQAGKYFGPRSFGHLGFTGTSLWVDPERRLSVTLLTNRTWPTRENQAVRQVRPQFHDAIIESLGNP